MSLVGPRPLPTDEQQRIQSTHRRRLSMRPGITGLWQVSGRSDVDFEQWMMLDLQYIDEWSLQLDATVLLKTIREVLLRTGAK
jgi:lipopolysaccharide/colanic/teichoic acid biosynthesis glycosyltransferase